ncbi:MAG: SH3 domain-containing protein [Planctomycetes bacterium]|nr:SH3 domain-containing protein [Planctomycetota bacterium]
MVEKKIWAISGWAIALAVLSIGSLFSQVKSAEPKVAEPKAAPEATENAKASGPEEVVEVTVPKLNLRAGNGINYPVVQSLTKGEKLVVVNDKSGWLEVQLPDDTKCWITKKYVEITNKEKSLGVVKVGRINVRSRPESGENIIGHITEGQTIKVKSEKGEWYQIAPTENLTGWVNKKYTRYWGNRKIYDDLKNKTIQEEKNKQSLTAIFNQAEKLYDAELQKPPLQQNYTEVLRLYKEVINTTSDNELMKKSRERVGQIEPKQQILIEYTDAINKATTDKITIEKKYQERMAELYRMKEAPEPYDARGWMESEGKYIGRPAAHKLTMGGKTLFFLKSPSSSTNLDDYYGQYVGVKGKKVANKSGVAETIIIEKIDLLTEEDQ